MDKFLKRPGSTILYASLYYDRMSHLCDCQTLKIEFIRTNVQYQVIKYWLSQSSVTCHDLKMMVKLILIICSSNNLLVLSSLPCVASSGPNFSRFLPLPHPDVLCQQPD